MALAIPADSQLAHSCLPDKCFSQRFAAAIANATSPIRNGAQVLVRLIRAQHQV